VTLRVTRVYEWYKRFQEGRKNVEDDERSGRPSTSTTDENVEKVKEMVMNESQSEKSLMMLAYQLAHAMKFFRMYFGYETCDSKICSKIVEFRTKIAANGSCSGVTK